MSLRPRTETELRAVLDDRFRRLLVIVRQRVETARRYDETPDLGDRLGEAFASDTYEDLRRVLEVEEGL